MAEVTRIPIRSLELLEAGDFEALPGDVFVRGFVTAYAKCLELDADEVVARYTRCKTAPAVQPISVTATNDDENDEPAALPVAMLNMDAQSNKRVGVTFALILLLIVATLTISYFLRSTDSAGDGVTMLRSALG